MGKSIKSEIAYSVESEGTASSTPSTTAHNYVDAAATMRAAAVTAPTSPWINGCVSVRVLRKIVVCHVSRVSLFIQQWKC